MFRDIPHQVLYTDADYWKHGIDHGYILGQVPYHRSAKYFFSLAVGKIPEWRGRYSRLWAIRNLPKEYSLIYNFVYSAECLFFADWISKIKKIPIIVHIADHSISFEQKGVRNIISRAKQLICITDEMKCRYEKMLGRRDVAVLHNGAEEECSEIPLPSNLVFSQSTPFILTFIGGLFSHLHGDCVEDVFFALDEIKKEFPWVEFHLYGQRQPLSFLDRFIKQNGVYHHGIIMPLEKKYEIMNKAHCFLIPSSFKTENNSHYKYSFPTKLPELIASGRPILSYGPQNTATNRILGKYDYGLRLHHRSVRELAKTLKKLIINYDEMLSSSCKRLENKVEFSAKSIRSRLSKILDA